LDILKRTQLWVAERQADLVNMEVDIIAKYVERLSGTFHKGITVDFLQEHGFMTV